MLEAVQGFGARNNFWGAAKDYFIRGGFVNGLNPQITGRIWYVNTNSEADASERRGPVGSDSNSGRSPLSPFATVARALSFVDSYDIVMVDGVIREQVVAPLGVYDVTILGGANQPRQATSSGTPTGGGATWLAPTSPTASTPLLSIYEQGWVVANIFFGTVDSTPSILLKGNETTDYPDASHTKILNCRFGARPGGLDEIGIGGWNLFNCVFAGNRFQGLTGTAILGMDVGIRTPAENVIIGNFFRECVNAIDMPMNYGLIHDNVFKDITTKKIDVNAGADNMVGVNFFDNDQADITIANGYIGNASDTWRNYSKNTAAMTVGTPS